MSYDKEANAALYGPEATTESLLAEQAGASQGPGAQACADIRGSSPAGEVCAPCLRHPARQLLLVLLKPRLCALHAGGSAGGVGRLHEALNEISAAAAADPRSFTGFTKKWKPQNVFSDQTSMHQGAHAAAVSSVRRGGAGVQACGKRCWLLLQGWTPSSPCPTIRSTTRAREPDTVSRQQMPCTCMTREGRQCMSRARWALVTSAPPAVVVLHLQLCRVPPAQA